jgi:hypothetical protein
LRACDVGRLAAWLTFARFPGLRWSRACAAPARLPAAGARDVALTALRGTDTCCRPMALAGNPAPRAG